MKPLRSSLSLKPKRSSDPKFDFINRINRMDDWDSCEHSMYADHPLFCADASPYSTLRFVNVEGQSRDKLKKAVQTVFKIDVESVQTVGHITFRKTKKSLYNCEVYSKARSCMIKKKNITRDHVLCIIKWWMKEHESVTACFYEQSKINEFGESGESSEDSENWISSISSPGITSRKTANF